MDEKTKRYRGLLPGEIIQVGDEWKDAEGNWAPVTNALGLSAPSDSDQWLRRPLPDLWAPTQSPQVMPDGPGESFEAYRAKLAGLGVWHESAVISIEEWERLR